MAYTREIPRDLFNEANLLKCYGRLALLAMNTPGLEVDHNGDLFDIVQDPSCGAL